MVDKKYLEEAKQMLMGGYENQKVQLNNSFNQNVQGLEGQKAGVNQNFDNQLQQNAMNTTRSQNQYNNNTLARGLGRSVIPTIIVIMGSVVFRIVWVCTIFASIHTLMSLYLVYASAWAFTSIIGTAYFIIIFRKTLR